MPVETVTADNFAALITPRATVVLDVRAPWCTGEAEAHGGGDGPARVHLQASAQRHPQVVFGCLDADAEVELARDLGLRTLPSLLVIRERMLVRRIEGELDDAALERLIEQVRLIDMDELRAEMAAAAGDMDAIDH